MSDTKFGVGDLLSERKQVIQDSKDTSLENDKDIKPQSNKSLKTKKDNYIKLQKEAQAGDYVGVNARVLRTYRDHWAVEAKKKRTTVSETIVNALLKEFGEPEQ